jgi:hypothetical protein
MDFVPMMEDFRPALFLPGLGQEKKLANSNVAFYAAPDDELGSPIGRTASLYTSA